MPTYSKEVALEVHVRINGEPTREYTDDEAAADSDEITRYIEAIAGSEFEMPYTISGSDFTEQDMRVSCYVDGALVRSRIHHSSHGAWQTNHIIQGIREKQGDAEMIRMFRFKEIAIGAQAEHDTDATTNLGSIRLEFTFGIRKQRDEPLRLRRLPEAQKMTEKSLKGEAKSLCTELGTSKHSPSSRRYDFSTDEEPFATFVFKYRTRANLQALRITPLDTSPTPPTGLQVASNSPNTASASPTTIKKEVEEDRVIPLIANNTNSPGASSLPPVVTSTPAPRSRVASPSRQHPSTTPDPASYQQGLTKEEVIAMIFFHRGHDVGLANQSTKSLLGLLKYYENKESVGTGAASNGGKTAGTIKRERYDESESAATGRGKKKREVIVLDD